MLVFKLKVRNPPNQKMPEIIVGTKNNWVKLKQNGATILRINVQEILLLIKKEQKHFGLYI